MSLLWWQIAGAIFTSILGTLLHFTYEWSGKLKIVAFFSAVNESTWEHLKLLFWPTLLWSGISFLVYGSAMPGFLTCQALAIFAGMAIIIICFYTYTGILGRNVAAIDISLFFLGIFVAFATAYYCQSKGCFAQNTSQLGALLFLISFMVSFVYFTFSPPALGLFLDPTKGDNDQKR